jgi:hypothetical protein
VLNVISQGLHPINPTRSDDDLRACFRT